MVDIYLYLNNSIIQWRNFYDNITLDKITKNPFMLQNSVKSILIFFFILILKTSALTTHKHLTHIHHALKIAD
jgi:hypothetical protein